MALIRIAQLAAGDKFAGTYLPIGTAAGTVSAGNDARILAAAVPVAAAPDGFAPVTNTVSETLVAGLSLPAGAAVAGRRIQLCAGGTLLNSGGAGVTVILRLKLAGTAVLVSQAINIGANAAEREWALVADIMCRSATAQVVTATWVYGLADAANWAGASSAVGSAVGAADMSGVTPVEFSAQPGTAAATFSLAAQWAQLTRMG